MKLGRELAELTAGIDKLFRNTPRSDGFLDREGLIPVAVAAVEPTPLRDYADATARLEALRARLSGEAESELRRAYLDEMIDSLLALVETFEEKPLSYETRLRRQLRIDTTLVGDDVLDGYRRTIREKLDELGYASGDLEEDVRRWEEDMRVPSGEILATLTSYGEEACRRVNRMMFDMGEDWLEPVGRSNVPFSAYCDYPGRQLIINTDLGYTRYKLKHLACHEAFPGHLVHLGLRERYVADGVMPLDGAQVVTSSASSPLFEGIAENGQYFLDWIEDANDELSMSLIRLRSALRCNAAWMMHAEKRPIVEIVEVIAKAGYQDRVTVTSQLSLVNHGLRAPFVYSYWCGDMAVYDLWKELPRERRSDFWRYLYANMHTPKTLKAFWQ